MMLLAISLCLMHVLGTVCGLAVQEPIKYPPEDETYPTEEPTYTLPTTYYPPDYMPLYESSYCDLNEDEYGRPYYSPYDNYLPPYHPTYPGYRQTNDTPATYSVRRPESDYDRTYPNCVKATCNYRSETCYGTGVVYDSCNRRCTCVNGRTTDCCRVRKEWNCMSTEEKKTYLDAVVTVSTTSPYKSCYNALIAEHSALFTGGGIHGQQLFLPWHRWYILALETLLRQVNCSITVPYWNWSLEPTTWQQSQVWDSDHGFGGNGNPSCVQGGRFEYPGWTVTPSAGSDCLRRSFSGNVPDSAYVEMIQSHSVSSFATWHQLLSGNLHDNVHCRIGGDMCTQDSANDPIFFLHHCFIDKLWADWQNKGNAYKNLPFYSGNTVDMPGGHTSDHTPSHFYDLDNQPDCVKVCYQPECKPANLTGTLICPGQIKCNEYSPIKLARLIQRPVYQIPRDAFELFKVPDRYQYISNRFTILMDNYDDLINVLRDNGYEEGKRTDCTGQRNLNYDSYLYNLDDYRGQCTYE